MEELIETHRTSCPGRASINSLICVWVSNHKCCIDREELEDCNPHPAMIMARLHDYFVDAIRYEVDKILPLREDEIVPLAQRLFDDAKPIRDMHRVIRAKQVELNTFTGRMFDWCNLTGQDIREIRQFQESENFFDQE